MMRFNLIGIIYTGRKLRFID